MKCNVCNSEAKLLFKGLVLNKYNVSYFKCPICDFIQTEKPHWLDEAYDSAITDLDVGLVSRNLEQAKAVEGIIKNNFNYNSKFLDYAGGYGLFVRLMRDSGLDFYRQDKYCENIFAKNFDMEDVGRKTNFEAITAFEVFEHLEKPLDDIKKMLGYSDTIIFSTQLQPEKKLKSVNDWWYFAPETGQHISFYTKKTLRYIANKYHLFFYSMDNFHLLTKKKFKYNPLSLNQIKEEQITKSLTQSDFELAKKFIEKAIKNRKDLEKQSQGERPKKGDPNEGLLNKLSLISAQLDQKSEELIIAKRALTKMETELFSSDSRFHSIRDELNSTANELSEVYASRSWRLARLFQKIAKVFFPAGSLRRKIAGILFRILKKIIKIPIKIKNVMINLLSKCEIVFFRLKPRKKRRINKNSKKIAYIGHSYHGKTQSTGFLIEYLKKFYKVEEIKDESWRGEGDEYPDLSHIDESYLAVIFFQNLPDQKILKNIKNENLIFFPMYDATSTWDYSKWKNLRGIKIANFSSTLHKKLLKWGFESMSVQYFPEPHEFIKGKKNEIFFWQRLTNINISLILKLFGKEKPKIHLHKAIDPGQQFSQPTKEEEKRFGITYSDWFKSRGEMWDLIREKAIYVAPREYEGIGLSFLEAMSMGKAVIAVDNPTMNEYIENNKTGYLFDLSRPEMINLSNIEKIQKNTYEYMRNGYKKWEKDKHRIIDFIESE